MRILFNTSSLGAGGAERVISNLANHFIKANDVIILVNNKSNIAYKLEKKIKIIDLDEKKIKNNLIRNLMRIIKSKKIIESENPDIIISFLPIPSYRILLLKKLKIIKKPVIISVRNDPKNECNNVISKYLMKTLYPVSDGCVFQTEEQKNYFGDDLKNKSTIIYNPIRDEFTKPNLNVKREQIIINVGRLVEQKNQKLLISAFANIVHKYPNYKLKIFGDGPLESELQSYINDLNLNDKVSLCGTTKNIMKELLKAEIFVLSSDYEGMPNALIEAMACGLSCISTDCPCGGPRALIINNKNGILIETNNELQLTEKIEYILINKKNAIEMGNEARKVVDKLLLDNISKEWMEYINKILENYY